MTFSPKGNFDELQKKKDSLFSSLKQSATALFEAKRKVAFADKGVKATVAQIKMTIRQEMEPDPATKKMARKYKTEAAIETEFQLRKETSPSVNNVEELFEKADLEYRKLELEHEALLREYQWLFKEAELLRALIEVSK